MVVGEMGIGADDRRSAITTYNICLDIPLENLPCVINYWRARNVLASGSSRNYPRINTGRAQDLGDNMTFKKRWSRRIYRNCNYKGTFVNCHQDICYSCHRDSLAEIAKKMNKLWYVRIWKKLKSLILSLRIPDKENTE